jgi:hypothetical protein
MTNAGHASGLIPKGIQHGGGFDAKVINSHLWNAGRLWAWSAVDPALHEKPPAHCACSGGNNAILMAG